MVDFILYLAFAINEVIIMFVPTDALVSITEANENFSKVTRLVDEAGLAVISKDNKPCYIVLDFEDYDEVQAIRAARRQKIEALAEQLIADNLEAFQELAK